MKPLSAKRTQRSSLRATKNLVTELGGKLVPGSGSGLEKGDGRVLGRFRIETKRPPTGKYRLTFKDWEKIRDAAVRAHEIPVFHLVLGNEEYIILRSQDYAGLGGTAPLAGAYSYGASTMLYRDCLAPTHEHRGVRLDGPKKSYWLRIMSRSDFTQLAEESA